MKKWTPWLLALALLISTIGLAACQPEEETPAEKIEEGVEDVGDGLEDAAEDVGDAVEDAADDIDGQS